MARITIIGLGLIGGSIGLALKQRGIKDLELVGHSRSKESSERALSRGAVDRVCWNINDAMDKADLVIVATPVLTVESVFQAIGEALPDGCTVTDVSSTKAQVMRWAKQHLPERISFVGGHPMAGKEKAGIEQADATLFRGCTYCITPSDTASDAAIRSVTNLAELLGANPFFIDPEEHDGLVAGISHLPMLLSTALVSCTTGSSSWQDMARLASTGYRDISRLASGDPEMHYSIFRTNSSSIIRWIDTVIEELQKYRQLIDSGDETLPEILENIKAKRDRWLENRAFGSAGKTPLDVPGPGAQMRQLLGGELFFRNPPKTDT